ncbi:malonate decarboxylase holo-[acyl-carrier-protein] synthase [Methylibium sp.]|uniref:malonate decarboxylase holo-[acyl-carrier-protein] synthase n=1 Tax=Methylibium sp. TaxID=2067992 RepID=UPI00286C9F5D|nr:malonate decarboxylase holo-[acyl-carrier-protein] synthase [Methylibium sp.]
MDALRRHQLVWLDDGGWDQVLRASRDTAVLDAAGLACLEHWAEQRWPLVVTRQGALPGSTDLDAPLALGLPAPARWGRRRIGVLASRRALLRHGEFASAAELTPSLPRPLRRDWQRLCDGLSAFGVTARVYGSHGWQRLTGLDYVHDRSDIDLLLDVASAAHADRVCALLEPFGAMAPRIDGELAFTDGSAVAWREWVRLRAGQTGQVLVKHLAGATLRSAGHWAVAA